MPNHVRNVLQFKTDVKKLNQILSEIQNDKEGIGSIDFNKITPMPQELNIEKGSRTTKGCEMFEDFCKKVQQIKSMVEPQNLTPERYKWANEQKDELLNKFNSMCDEDKELFNLGKQFFENVNNYGYGDWYDWSVANWGTKWNAYDSYHNKDTIEFNTAWSTPEPIIVAISNKYPDVKINHCWADEDMGTNLGEREYLNGETTYENIPDAFSKEAYDIAFKVWEEIPENYGLKLSDDGTEYVEYDEETDNPLLLTDADETDDEIEE